jgi:ABC-type multidrug transport system ATPase subunit
MSESESTPSEPLLRDDHSFVSEGGSSLQFSDANFTVGTDKKVIIQSLSATVHSGQVLAIMGPSGAGKTTLLNLLTLSAFGGKATGSVRLDGHELTLERFTAHCAVVEQNDFHWACLTARESLAFAKELYGADADSAAQNQEQVDQLLHDMGLTGCADTQVGNEFRKGLSGGQKRRLSVALAVVKKPKVIFLDEPTSGLDAASAASIMRFLKDLSQRSNIIVICTIHQPSAKVFEGFDQCMLLSEGRCAFKGPAADVEGYFGSIGHKMPANNSPAEFMLDIVSRDFSDTTIVASVLEEWSKHEHNEPDVERERNLAMSEGAVKDRRDARGCAGTWKQVSVLTRRQGLLIVRDPMLYGGRMAGFMLVCCFFAVMYIKARERSQSEVLYRLFFMMWLVGVPTALSVVSVYVGNHETSTLRKEVRNGMVAPTAYVAAQIILELPLMFVLALSTFGVSGYLMVGMYLPSMLRTLSLFALALWAFEATAQTCAVAFNNPMAGMLLYMGVWFSSFLFCGIMIPQAYVVRN